MPPRPTDSRARRSPCEMRKACAHHTLLPSVSPRLSRQTWVPFSPGGSGGPSEGTASAATESDASRLHTTAARAVAILWILKCAPRTRFHSDLLQREHRHTCLHNTEALSLSMPRQQECAWSWHFQNIIHTSNSFKGRYARMRASMTSRYSQCMSCIWPRAAPSNSSPKDRKPPIHTLPSTRIVLGG